MRKRTNDEFIKQSKLKHKDKFDYIKTVYEGSNKNVIITCKEHGDFVINAQSHLEGKGGCRECNKIMFRELYSFDNEKVLSIIKDVHGDLYDTSKVTYINQILNITLICKKHGDFNIRLDKIKTGQGCPKCSKKASYFSGYEIYPTNTKLIPLNNGDFTIVDEEDYDKLKEYNWSSSIYGYVSNSKLGKMHRYLLNAPEGTVVDHKNRVTYDNRKSNLRITTDSGNGSNKVCYKGVSKLKGVTWHKCGKWRARVSFGKKRLSLGLFKTEEEAGIAYDLGAIQHQGEFCVLNFPEKKEEYLEIIRNSYI